MSSSLASAATPAVQRAASHVGKLIRQARLARTMTQAELAVRARTSPATVMRIEKGSVEAGMGNVLMLMEQLGLLQHITAISDPTTQVLLEHKGRKRARASRSKDMDF